MLATFKKQQQLVNTLLSHPQYGKYVRTFRGTLYTPVFNFCEGDDIVSEEELWRAIESLTHVQSVIAGSRNRCISPLTELRTQIPGSLFQSATSVTLVGEIQYELAKSILCGINPATLMHLSLDVVQDRSLKYFGSEVSEQLPGDIGEDGRIIAYGALSGLLTPLTGHCTALGTLILRRVEQIEKCPRWHAAAEAASYMESAAFIDSVRSTVQSLTWEQVEDTKFTPGPNSDRVVDKSFQRLILPTIVSGTWPCLTKIRLRGVSSSDEQGGTDGLITQLRAVLSGSTTIEVSGEGESKQAF
ncbi:hypothetical protein MMC07_002542 [Pseudocyphellaria aurata]|nr:hypothetical protein [Pseudocyphellaria aurata]